MEVKDTDIIQVTTADRKETKLVTAADLKRYITGKDPVADKVKIDEPVVPTSTEMNKISDLATAEPVKVITPKPAAPKSKDK